MIVLTSISPPGRPVGELAEAAGKMSTINQDAM